MKNVRMSDELFHELDCFVFWGDPDEEGFYTPEIYKIQDSTAGTLGLVWDDQNDCWVKSPE